MRFQVLDILPYIENPVTGRLVSPAERYAQALAAARRAEELGYDAVALGKRHAGPFLSSGVTVLLGAIAAATSRVRIQTGVCVLSILDPAPIRAAAVLPLRAAGTSVPAAARPKTGMLP